MTILVTGGAGFVMSNLVKRWLSNDPSEHAIVVDTLPLDANTRRFFEPVLSRIDWQVGDVLDKGLWQRLSANHQINYLVHGAAATSILRHMHTQGPGKPGLSGARNALAVNIDGVLNVLEFAASLPNLQRMVHVSSGSVYGEDGPAHRPLLEHEQVVPEGLYGISKFAGEAFCSFCNDELNLPVFAVRLSGVYGPMDRITPSRDVQCVPNIIVHKGLKGETIRVRSMQAIGDFIHAEDVGSAIISLLLAPALNHKIYNVAAGQTHSVEELTKIAREQLPAITTQVVTSGELDIDTDPERVLGRWGAYDISKIHQDTGWQPRALTTAFPAYIEWIRKFET